MKRAPLWHGGLQRALHLIFQSLRRADRSSSVANRYEREREREKRAYGREGQREVGNQARTLRDTIVSHPERELLGNVGGGRSSSRSQPAQRQRTRVAVRVARARSVARSETVQDLSTKLSLDAGPTAHTVLPFSGMNENSYATPTRTLKRTPTRKFARDEMQHSVS